MAEMTDIHRTQAAAEGVEIVGGVEKVTFCGEEYRIAESIGQMPLLKFAAAAEQGADSDDMAGYAAMYALIKDCIDPAEWARFERDAISKKADGDDLFKVVTDVIQIIAARPTRRPSDSSAGPRTISDSSKGISSAPAPGPAVPATAPEPEQWAELVSIDELVRNRGARLTA